MPSKIRVAVLYGGRSGEHEVSLRSAASVVRNLDQSRYDIIPVAIDKSGRWLLHQMADIAPGAVSLPVRNDRPAVVLPPYPQNGAARLLPLEPGAAIPHAFIDIIFPVMHGPLCEDGTIQGIMELAGVAYVGCGVAGSAVGMDKDISKRLAQAAGVPVVPWITLLAGSYDPAATHRRIISEIGLPCFIKPANMGSSVGVVKVKTPQDLPAAIELALGYDTKVLVEKAINCREIEVAVLESLTPGEPPIASIPGEVTPTHEFYSYEAKYLDDNGAALSIPANLSKDAANEAQRIARDVFVALDGEGLTRCDFLLDKDSGVCYFNEVNTMPGFTSISMYPKLMEASGVPYPRLLDHLIELALRRHARKSSLQRDYSSQIA